MSDSIKYDNFVYMTICEATMELFKKSNCVTYQNYCRLLGSSIIDGNLSKNEFNDICYIFDTLDKIFYMDSETTNFYINNFFNKEKYKKFELTVRYMFEVYPINIFL